MSNKDLVFIEKAEKVHGKYYDYSKVEYINNRTKVCIICPDHGEFWQVPKDHLNGCGCPCCARKSRSKGNEKFVVDAQKIHGDKYDYSKVEYENANKIVTITCPIHGDFSMRPTNHLKGQGCKECAKAKMGAYQKSDTGDFIGKSRLAHGDKYDYSKVEYVNNRVKVKIICPIHGEFIQKPLDHIQGRGCPECGKKLGVAEKQVLEVMKENFNNVEYQYSPEWLHGKTSPQSLDIYLPDHKIAIEYQGRQHFYSNKIFGGEEGFLLTQKRDKRKYQKCIEKGVKLFYISFEKKVPDDYFEPVYKTTEELLNAIDLYIKEKENKQTF